MAEHERTKPDAATRDAERREARVGADPGAAPTSEEDEAADEAADVLEKDGTEESVAEHYREMTERGAHQQGEGRLP